MIRIVIQFISDNDLGFEKRRPAMFAGRISDEHTFAHVRIYSLESVGSMCPKTVST